MLAALHLVASPEVELSNWHIPPETNPAVLEASAWRAGRLDLDAWREGQVGGRIRDTALVDGKIYNVYPPLFTGLSVIALTLGDLVGVPGGTFFPPWYVLLVALPLPLVGFWAFQQVLGKPDWSAVLTGYWLVGTPMLPMLGDCKDGSINAINQVLATAGLMLIAGDLLGRKRIWPAVIGLLIAAWTRQLTLIFGLPILWVAWRATDARRQRKGAVAAAGLAVAGGLLMALNWLKFGSPVESGYAAVYEEREADPYYATRCREHGLCALVFVPENARLLNLMPPRFRITPEGIQQANDNEGVSIWMTTPLLLGVLLGITGWWRKPGARALMGASLVVVFLFLTYHSPGTPQVGYYRYALDVIPVWMVVVAPWAIVGWRRHATLACLAWSALYFRMLP
jgi:hypothetical protein